MRRKSLRILTGSLQMVRGPLKIPKYRAVKNRCRACGGPVPKGRHTICSIGCKIDYRG